jgi:hypothetical protein
MVRKLFALIGFGVGLTASSFAVLTSKVLYQFGPTDIVSNTRTDGLTNTLGNSGSIGSGTGKMDFSANATASAEFGSLHEVATASVTNTQGPFSMSDIFGDSRIEAVATASFTDTLTFGGNIQLGDFVRYDYSLDGGFTTTGDISPADRISSRALLGLEVNGNPEGSGASVDSHLIPTQDSQSAQVRLLSFSQTVQLTLTTDALIDLDFIGSGNSGSITGDFSHTGALTGIEVFDSQGNERTGWTLSSGSGHPYNQIPPAVPEPASLMGLAAAVLAFVRRRR